MNYIGTAVRAAIVGSLAALAACSSAAGTSGLPTASTTGSTSAVTRQSLHLRAFAADCSATAVATATALCTNIELAPVTRLGAGAPASSVPGLKPVDFMSAYQLPTTGGTGQKIAIVVANQAPNAEADLAVYRSTFGLPACTTANGCLQVVADSKDVAPDAQWSREAATDLDMASAACPKCSLLFVEAKSTKDSDLAHAVNTAVQLGANVVSLSFAIPEGPGESNGMWSHPGVAIVAAAGDTGYGVVNWPAASTNVIAVGATTLARAAGTARGWTETAWAGTTSGCSTSAPKPVWQKDSGCSKRTVADVAVVGDPQTPVAVYNSYQDYGWIQVGGTSVSAPIVAGMVGLAGNAASLNGASWLYGKSGALFAVTGGSNGICTAAYLCTANGSYSGPSGLGAPNGITAL